VLGRGGDIGFCLGIHWTAGAGGLAGDLGTGSSGASFCVVGLICVGLVAAPGVVLNLVAGIAGGIPWASSGVPTRDPDLGR
jgi:hypothetical protein